MVIKRDLGYTKEALECVIHYGEMPFGGISDIEELLNGALKSRQLTANDLLNEVRFIQGLKSIIAYEKGLDEVEHPQLHELIDTLIVHTKVEDLINQCLDDYGEVKDNASSTLRDIRRSLIQVDNDIQSAINKFIGANKDSVVDSIATYRANRAVVLVRASDKNSYGGMVYGDSSSGQASYVEPAALIPLNNKKIELVEREKEEINRILKMCSEAVTEVADEELANLETVALLDSIFAKAKWGKEFDAIIPTLTEEKKISLVKARHPLIDAKLVVPNTYTLEDPQRMLLITGPNTGGKTVSMKIIGLFVLLTYAGLPIPCDEGIIPFFDNVYADIGDDQSVMSSLSSFSSHIEKQSIICEKATENSLVLLDEVGSGTDPREGESLAIAILNHLRDIHCMCVTTTHYGRLKAYGKRHDDIKLASVEFDQVNLQPTYRYLEGMTGNSNALEVAEKYGLPKNIIQYARFLKNQSKTEEENYIERLDNELQKEEALNRDLQARLEEVEKLQAALDKQQKILDNDKEKILDKAQEEAANYIRQIQDDAEELMASLRKQQESIKLHEAIAIKSDIDALGGEDIVLEDEEEDYEPQVGDYVELKSSKQICEVVEVNKKEVVILMNGITVKVKPNQIRKSNRKPVQTNKETTSIRIDKNIKLSTIPLECNLIGMHVDEALETMKDYMDDAKVHGLKNFRIIHGDGTGALRNAVHSYLKKNKDVEEYRLGMPQEGGTGATVVKMK